MPTRNPILDLPLLDVMRFEIALPLQHMFESLHRRNFLKPGATPAITRHRTGI